MERLNKPLTEYTKKEFLEMKNFGPEGLFTSIVIVPTNDKHDSGYRCMKFILIGNDGIVGVVSGWSDVVHINGIGGYGKDYKSSLYSGMTKRVGWSIDCLTKSRCLRLFSNVECSADEFIGSDFCFYVEESA